MASDLAAGTTLAGYRIQGLVGRGGMGVVYRATQLSLEREVALKLIAPDLASEDAFRDRFLREARIAASLEHPHVLPVHEAGEAEGVLYLAMRFVEGESLAEVLARQGQLEPPRAASLVAQIAEALAAAHDAGLVHRDVKPANVLIVRAGTREHVYLCDFGLSRRTSGATELTKTGGFVGSVSYAAPEQIKGEPVDARTDIYALGCLLYECLTGEPPFPREHEAAVLWAHLNEPAPSPSALRPELGDAFDWVIDRALAKDPEERFPSADAFVAAFLAEAPPPRRRPSPPAETNLPIPASSFLGRERELDEVGTLLARPELRLLTLTGPGGTGKTRLALRVAEQASAHYRDGIHWVGLASLRDPALVTETIAQTLGAKDGLAEHVGEREILLLLDNLEHVIESAPELGSLLSSCPNLTLLVTSRELLRVQGEVEYPVPPLVAPEAVSLFCERSRLEPGEEIAELCARLDSLPLAVELAAARTKALSPAKILERLKGRLDLLKGGRDADPRQQTLRATIEWSYDLLSPAEQQLFARLSVFAGGCTLEAAEEVCDADLDTLQSLVEKSLLRFSGERYWMLETIREYAGDRLEATGAEAAQLQRRHVKFMERQYGELDRANPSSWVAAVEAERDNLRVALRWSLDEGLSETSLVLANSYASLCFFDGPYEEGKAWLIEALAKSSGTTQLSRWRALNALCGLAHRQGDFEQSLTYAEDALLLARTLDDHEVRARSLRALGLVEGSREHFDRSEALQREALAIFTELGSEREIRESLGMLAYLPIARGDLVAARPALEEALARSREAGDERGVHVNSANLGHVLARLGHFEEALSPLRESVLLGAARLEVQSVADQLEDVCIVAVGLRRYEQAAVMLGGSEALYEVTGSGWEPVGKQAHEEVMATLRRKLNAEQLKEMWKRGRRMSVEGLVEYAVDFIDTQSAMLGASPKDRAR